jgi:hypothetical protein
MSVLKMYKASDNSLVSEAGQFGNAINFTLRADLEQQESVRLYAMCDTGYEATEVEVEGEGTSIARWEIAPDNDGSEGAYQAASTPLELGTVGAGVGGRVYFWVRASALDTEPIGIDNTVTFKLEGIGAAV